MRIRALSGDLAQFRFSIFSHFFEQVKKMAEISDLDWAQHIKIDYAQNLRKNPAKAKKWTLTKFLYDSACPFSKRAMYDFMQKYDKTGFFSIKYKQYLL